MPKKSTGGIAVKWPGDLGEPIVVRFRGVPDCWMDPSSEPGVDKRSDTFSPKEEFPLDGLPERLDKLVRLADYYGIERSGDPGWGLLLAHQIACDLHPGFELVYDDWMAEVFKRLYGLTPRHRLKEGESPRHRPRGTGWAPELVPELVALMADTLGKAVRAKHPQFTDRRLCEIMAISFDPGLKTPSRRRQLQIKINTLQRRLSEGRRRRRTGGLPTRNK